MKGNYNFTSVMSYANELKRIVLWILTILMVTIIFIFSSQDATVSSNVSKSFTKQILQPICEAISDDVVEQERLMDSAHFLLREGAHIFLYFALSIVLSLLLHEYAIPKWYLLCFALCFLCAIADEFNQKYFTIGRSFELIDLLKDWGGAFVGTSIIKYYMWISKKTKSAKDVR